MCFKAVRGSAPGVNDTLTASPSSPEEMSMTSASLFKSSTALWHLHSEMVYARLDVPQESVDIVPQFTPHTANT